MAIAATTNESLDNTVIGNNSKNTNSQDLHNSFLTLLVAQLKTVIRPIRCRTTS